MSRSFSLSMLLLASASCLFSQTVADLAAGKAQFEARCGGCHGGDGKGGARAPDVVTPGMIPRRTADEVRELISGGLPANGMPGLSVPEPAMTQLVAFYLSVTAPAMDRPISGDVAAGEKVFFSTGCANCHTRGPKTRVIGPDLASIGAERTMGEIETSIRHPSTKIETGYEVVDVKLNGGETLKAFARNRSNFDLQLQTFDGRFRFLSRDDFESVTVHEKSLMPAMKVSASQMEDLTAFLSRQDGETGALAKLRNAASASASPRFGELLSPKSGDWPSYNGRMDGNRHSGLDQINESNVDKLRPAWTFPVPTAPRDMEMTPLVVDGVMYVTTANTVIALDAEHGREIWRWSQPQTEGVMGDAGSGANRGVAVLGDHVFFVTDHAHMIAIDRITGRKVWDTEMADFRQHYGGTLAPLVVKDVVIGGVGGGDEGIRGFLAAFDVTTGEERWRFWTIPLPGEPLSETWKGSVLPHGCGGTWLTGAYDPELDLLYWPIGNPCPDMNGNEREGDNLYSDSMLALDPDTGELAWHYQYTPHDEFDFDANQPPLLVDMEWEGEQRKLLLHANRNGFFYVLDRSDGELLRAEPFVKKLTWASHIDENGRPVLVPGKRPTYAGNVVCPGMAGATNWPSKSYSPETGLYYVQATEYCQTYTKRDEKWELGKAYFGGASKPAPGDKPSRYLRAIDVKTGKLKWEIHQGDHGWRNWSGILSTASGLIVFGDDSGAFVAVRASDGKPLWRHHMNVSWRSSPMTYMAGGKQFIATAAGDTVVAFAVVE